MARLGTDVTVLARGVEIPTSRARHARVAQNHGVEADNCARSDALDLILRRMKAIVINANSDSL
jgi:hypothetical protein